MNFIYPVFFIEKAIIFYFNLRDNFKSFYLKQLKKLNMFQKKQVVYFSLFIVAGNILPRKKYNA